MEPQFRLGYQGKTTYSWLGKTYAVRHYATDDEHYSEDYFETGILPSCGTVRCEHNVCEFPPPALCAHFPGYVPARWDHDSRRIVYLDNQAPEVIDQTLPGARSQYVARVFVIDRLAIVRELLAKATDGENCPNYIALLHEDI